jgi:hypothetical protein
MIRANAPVTRTVNGDESGIHCGEWSVVRRLKSGSFLLCRCGPKCVESNNSLEDQRRRRQRSCARSRKETRPSSNTQGPGSTEARRTHYGQRSDKVEAHSDAWRGRNGSRRQRAGASGQHGYEDDAKACVREKDVEW